jgi:hypothetical protein
MIWFFKVIKGTIDLRLILQLATALIKPLRKLGIKLSRARRVLSCTGGCEADRHHCHQSAKNTD